MKNAIPRTELKQVHGRNMRTSRTNKSAGSAAAQFLTQKAETHQRAAKLAAVKNMSVKLAMTQKTDSAVAALTRNRISAH